MPLTIPNPTNLININIPSMNLQHDEIIDCIQDIRTALEQSEDKETISILLRSLVSLSRQYFDDEEKEMLHYHYPNIDSHIGRHMAYNELLSSLVINYQQGSIATALNNLSFLTKWFIEHIATADYHFCIYKEEQRDFL